MRDATIGILLAALGVGCHPLPPGPTGPTTTVVTTIVTSGGPAGGSGPPNPQPGTGTPTGPRTADPLTGQILALPAYGQGVVDAVAGTPAGAAALAQLCLLGGAPSFAFVDLVVDRLRVQDTRWGYLCGSGICATPVVDVVAYHATAGADVSGAIGVWAVDVASASCAAQWAASYQSAGVWTTRGRF